MSLLGFQSKVIWWKELKTINFPVSASTKYCRSISWMTPAVPGRSATGRVAAALLMSFLQTSPAPRATSSWSGTTAGKRKAQMNALSLKIPFPFIIGTFLCFSRHVSFVDCPGHDILMATMLNGAAVMDAALLLIGRPLIPSVQQTNFDSSCVLFTAGVFIWPCSRVFLPAGNESCPQPQTSEHLAAIEIMKLKHILILQNKIDLVKESQAKEQYEQILAFVQGESLWTCNQHQTLIVSWNTATFCPFQTRDSSGHFILPLTLTDVMFLLQAQWPRALPSFLSQHSWSTTSRWFVSTSSKRSQCLSETSRPSPDSSVRAHTFTVLLCSH